MLKKTLHFIAVLATLTLLQSCNGNANAKNKSEVADWVLVNGKILTVDDNFTIAQAIAIKDSIIIETGTTHEMLSYRDNDTKVTDLEGKTVIPGLIDNHSHFVRAAKHWYRMVRWDDVLSRKEALESLKNRSNELPDNEWIIVLGSFILEQFKDDDSIFTIEELDKLFPDRPVFIQEGYSRAFVNTATLKASGLWNKRSSKYSDSIIESKGVLNAKTQAYQIVFNAIPEPSAATWDKSISSAIDSLLKMGLTTVMDMGGKTVTQDFYSAVERLMEKGELDIRFFYTLNAQNSNMSSPEETKTQLQTHKPNFKNLQFAQFCFGETTYPPMRSNPFQISDEDLEVFKDIIKTAIKNDWQIHEHTLQEEKVKQMLDVLEALSEEYPKMKDLRFTIAHTDGMSLESIKRAINLDMVFAVHSTSRLMTKKQHEMGIQAPPARNINDLGGIWGLGSDGTTVASPNPFHTLGWIVSGKNISGKVFMSQTVSREDALRAHTANNAYLLFKEDKLGSLEKGKRADLVVLNKDYLSVNMKEIENIRSLLTVLNGEIVYEY